MSISSEEIAKLTAQFLAEKKLKEVPKSPDEAHGPLILDRETGLAYITGKITKLGMPGKKYQGIWVEVEKKAPLLYVEAFLAHLPEQGMNIQDTYYIMAVTVGKSYRTNAPIQILPRAEYRPEPAAN